MKKEIVVAIVVFVCLVGVIIFVEVGKRRKAESEATPVETAQPAAGLPTTGVTSTTPAGLPEATVESTPAGSVGLQTGGQDTGATAARPIVSETTAPGRLTLDALPTADHAAAEPSASTNRLESVIPTNIPDSYAIQAKDTLSGIADRVLGSHKFAPLIMKKNPGIHPERLNVGAKLAMPGRDELQAFARTQKPAPAKPAGTAGSTAPAGHKERVPAAGTGYVVKKGDTLYSIAEKELGGAKHVKTIETLNPGVDPKHLREGQHLVLPEK